MEIKQGSGWDDGQVWWKRTEVIVSGVTEDRISYDHVLGWRYGIPTKGENHSMTRQRFEETFPNKITFEQAF